MINFKILYLEHDEERFFYKQAMESCPSVVVDLISEPTENKLRELLAKNRFDLIITDANFLPEGQSHTADRVGDYKLNEIITVVREIDSRVKIAVLTNYSPALLKDRDDDLKTVDYLWDKTSTPDDFLKWQISAIQREITRESPEQTLLNALEKLVHDAAFVHPWKDTLSEMVKSYKSTKNEKDRVLNVKKHFLILVSDLSIDTEFAKLYDAILEMEAVNIVGKPQAWGHLRHVLNVFWFGFYLLNCGALNKEFIARKLQLENGFEVDSVWLIASLFHDIGYLGEIAEKITENCNKLTSLYPGIPVTFPSATKDPSCQKVKEKIAMITTGLPPINAPLLTDLSTPFLFDHGVLSAATIVETFTGRKAAHIAIPSAAAVVMHNLVRPKLENQYNKRFYFKDYPLGTLLIFCDLIEAWERETGLETFMASVPIEAVQLSILDVNSSDRSIKVKINYLPFKYILPAEHSMRAAEENIRNNIIKFVLPGLNSVDLSSTGYTYSVEFILDGRITVAKWES